MCYDFRPGPLPLCLWVVCGLPAFAGLACGSRFVFGLGGTGWPLSAADPGEPIGPFWSYLARSPEGSRQAIGPMSSESPCPLGGPVEGLVSLQWL